MPLNDWPARCGYALLYGLVFTLAYSLPGWMAQQQGVSAHIATAWDAHIPLWPWAIVPYATSGVWLLLGFAALPDRAALRLFTHRLLLATVVAGVVFAAWPLRFSGFRFNPTGDESALLRLLWAGLAEVDTPYNQCPSLHVAYAVIVWASLSTLYPTWLWRGVLALAMGALVASALLTHQHHLWDVVAGAALGWACVYVRSAQRDPPVAWVHGYYALASGLALTMAVLAYRWGGEGWWVGTGVSLYLTGAWALVAWVYARDKADFLHKIQGRFPWWIVVLYGPYLASYGLTWWAVRWRERHHPPCEQVAEGLWVGRRLSDAEARIHLPARCHLIDLANELPATSELLRHALSYQHLPLLDLRPIPAPQEISIFRAIQSAQQSGGPVYVHCAMGYARSRQIVAAYLKSSFSSVS